MMSWLRQTMAGVMSRARTVTFSTATERTSVSQDNCTYTVQIEKLGSVILCVPLVMDEFKSRPPLLN